MAMLTTQSCWTLVTQALLVNFNCVQRCQSFVTVVTVGCGLTVSPRSEGRLESPPREQQTMTSHLRADTGPCIVGWQYFDFTSAIFLNSNTLLSMYLFCNSRIHVITLYSDHICVHYTSIIWCWHLVCILIKTDHPYLGVGCHMSTLWNCGRSAVIVWCSYACK
jgi:hypothetical protein